MALVTLKDVDLAFGGPMLLEGADLQIEKGERICLIGRNGAGKSTLLKLVDGELLPDRGAVSREPGLKTSMLPQEVSLGLHGSVYDVVASGQGENAALLVEHHRLSRELVDRDDRKAAARLCEVQHALETAGAWRLQQQVRTAISRLGLDESAPFGELSAGLKRRVYLARALASDPDLLLLDEPTNHLDIDAILWMESFLLRYAKTMLFVTHDRAFLDRVASRIVELDRARLVSFPGSYEGYLCRKEEMLENEAARAARLDKRVQREETWFRQGIKARRTRNEGRVRALMAMRAEVERRRARMGNVRLSLQEAERSGKQVIVARHITFAYDEEPVVLDFTATIMRGEKVGIIGPNGCGKTTLLRILLGEIVPDKGSVRQGAGLEVAYFDQLRAQLDEGKTLQQNVSGGGDTVFVNGKARNVIGYLQDFLFSPDQARAPITALSGGERNRLLLARLFARPSNVLVLDEPTNDLDPETLELLEAMLIEYAGTVLMVSHDRAFLNNVASSTLVFEGRGRVREYVGGYDDWVRQRPAEAGEGKKPASARKKPGSRPSPVRPRRLTFKDQRELAQIPDLIEKLEAERLSLFDAMSDPAFYKRPGDEIARHTSRLDDLERELAEAYARWEHLEGLVLEAGG